MNDERERVESMTLRLAPDLRRELETVAMAEESSISEEIRSAITSHLAKKRRDVKFQQRLRDKIRQHEQLLKALD